jgi:NAD(P)H-flavin reductase
VLENVTLGAYRLLRVADAQGHEPAPGQFAMLAAVDEWGGGGDERPYLPRAFSIARWHARGDAAGGSEGVAPGGGAAGGGGEAEYLLEDVGPGTHRLCALAPGEALWVLGPLGSGFTLPPIGRRAILVGGGVGIAPLAILQDALGSEAVTVLLGFRDGARAQGAALLRGAQIATDDGSVGRRCLVTDLLAHELDGGEGEAPIVYACGPAPMLEAVRDMCATRAVPAQLALESGMACGFGACFGCVVPRRGGGYLRVCIDGPVLDAAELEHVDAHAGAPA